MVKEGDSFDINIIESKTTKYKPENIKLDIIYEDSDLIIINKQSGIVTHPAPGNETGTLVQALLNHSTNKLSTINGNNRPGIVHRLDMDTSGVIVVAKNEQCHRSLSDQFKNRTVIKRYLALVKGNMDEQRAIVEAPIGRDPHDRKKMAIVNNGRESSTEYRVAERYSLFDYLSIRPKTGRTHQIRVHLYSLGHPVAGDNLYGGRINGLERQFLHAESISFTHPVDNTLMEFKSPLAEDLLKFKDSLS